MRTLLTTLLALALAAAPLATAHADDQTVQDPTVDEQTVDAQGLHGRFDVPRHGWANDVLRSGTPERVGLDPAPIRAALDQVERYTVPDATGHPLFSGAV
ncbi:MAG: serine hydrolase, partial [Saccharothrix sp.]|nr:serine hydrolase [Saccharothrix sp.]